MNGMESIARLLISLGLVLLVLGGIIWFAAKVGGISIFRLPGDIYIKKENFTFYFPITTFAFKPLNNFNYESYIQEMRYEKSRF